MVTLPWLTESTPLRPDLHHVREKLSGWQGQISPGLMRFLHVRKGGRRGRQEPAGQLEEKPGDESPQHHVQPGQA